MQKNNKYFGPMRDQICAKLLNYNTMPNANSEKIPLVLRAVNALKLVDTTAEIEKILTNLAEVNHSRHRFVKGAQLFRSIRATAVKTWDPAAIAVITLNQTFNPMADPMEDRLGTLIQKSLLLVAAMDRGVTVSDLLQENDQHICNVGL